MSVNPVFIHYVGFSALTSVLEVNRPICLETYLPLIVLFEEVKRNWCHISED